jgi:hypothetical protein
VDCLHQSANAQNPHHAFHVVGQDVQRHFGSDMRERLHLEMRRSHPRLDRPKRMFRGLALARLFDASFRPRLAAIALASSLALHLHQVGRRTFTSKLLRMPRTRLKTARAVDRCGGRHDQHDSGTVPASTCGMSGQPKSSSSCRANSRASLVDQIVVSEVIDFAPPRAIGTRILRVPFPHVGKVLASPSSIHAARSSFCACQWVFNFENNVRGEARTRGDANGQPP